MSKRVKVAHNLDQFDQGETIILTLKDQTLLKGGTLNEDIQQLENAELRERGMTEHNTYLKKNIKKLAFAQTSHIDYKLEGKTGDQKQLLPHYDDHQYKREGFTVAQGDEDQEFKPTANIYQAIKQKRDSQKALFADEQRRPASQYAQAKIKNRKNNNLAKNPDKAAATKSLMSFLEQTAMSDEERDPLKRTAEQAYQELDKIRKRRNFDRAMEKAVINNAKTEERMRDLQEYELELAIKKQRKAQPVKSTQQVLAQVIKADAAVDPEKQKNNDTVQIQLDPLKVTLLSQSFKAPAAAKQVQLNIGDARGGMTSVLNVSLPSDRFRKPTAETKTVEQNLPDKLEQIPPQELQRMKQELEFMNEQQIGVGLSGTLKFMRERGLMEQQQYIGRDKDAVPKSVVDNSGDRIKLEYRDASGRLMTPKEAFRYQCWIFHGQGPGQNKIEKRKKKELLNQKVKAMQSGDSTLMKILKNHQSKNQQAHLFIKQTK